MSDPRSITADACEILITRELRKAGVEPIGLRRRNVHSSGGSGHIFQFDLAGRLEAYGHRWSVLIECRNSEAAIDAEDLEQLHSRARASSAASAILCTTSHFENDAMQRSSEHGILLLRVVDSQSVFVGDAAGPDQLPAWLPEFTLQIVSARAPAHSRLVEANQPELILSELRSHS